MGPGLATKVSSEFRTNEPTAVLTTDHTDLHRCPDRNSESGSDLSVSICAIGGRFRTYRLPQIDREVLFNAQLEDLGKGAGNIDLKGHHFYHAAITHRSPPNRYAGGPSGGIAIRT